MSCRRRSKEYAKLVLDVFMMNIATIEGELLQLSQLRPNRKAVYNGDVTYGEYEFLLLTELDFKTHYMRKESSLIHEVEKILQAAE